MAVVWPQIQPAEQPEPQQPGQWLYTHLPAVSGLCSPGDVEPTTPLTTDGVMHLWPLYMTCLSS